MTTLYEREASGRAFALKRRLQTRLGNLIALWLAKRLQRTSAVSAQRLGRAIAWLLPRLSPRHKRIVLANLRQAFGQEMSDAQLGRLAKEFYAHIGKCFAEFIRLPALSREEFIARASLEGEEHLRAALAAGKGAIILTGHVGNWEVTGARIAAAGFPLNVIARDQRDSDLTSFITATRERTGMRVISRDVAVRRTLACLKANEVIGILADQNAGADGIFVDFFDKLASSPAGPAAFALRTGAPVVPVFGWRQPDDTFHVVVSPPVEITRTGERERDLRENTARFTKVIETAIRRAPAQWFWLHKRWKARPPWERMKDEG